jgi:asparagine synthase (glutamine-hydrolysing)
MCGITGGVGKNVTESEVRNMALTLQHRGPDETKYWLSKNCKLAMTRLSIMDPNFGSQPFISEDKRITCVFNGEIFNYKSLRSSELKTHLFTSDCDGEVIPHLFEEFGPDFPNHCDGMFAIAIWDDEAQSLTLTRDHFGIKPLYYVIHESSLYFASEIKAFLKLEWFVKDIDYVQLNNYFMTGHTMAPDTIFFRIKQLLPGHSLTFDTDGKVKISKYWFPKQSSFEGSEAELAEELHRLLADSVKSRLAADVEVGCFLSGGVDSSIVAYLAAKNLEKPLKTYCLVYDGDRFEGKSSDQEWSRKLSNLIGSEHHEILMTSENLMQNISNIISSFDEPFAGVTSTYFLSKEISKNLKVALTGDGSDEMFGSYFYHRLAALMDSPEDPRLKENNLHLDDIELTEIAELNGELSRRMYILKNGDLNIPDMFSGDLRKFLDDQENSSLEIFRNSLSKVYEEKSETKSNLHDSLWLDFHDLLPNEVLPFVDRLSMAWSLELRPPFLTKEIYEFTLSLESRLLISSVSDKHILKKAFESVLPMALLYRQKEGFVLPIAFWMLNEMNPWMKSILSPERISIHGLLDAEKISLMLKNYTKPDHRIAKVLWRFIIFQLWWEVYFLEA